MADIAIPILGSQPGHRLNHTGSRANDDVCSGVSQLLRHFLLRIGRLGCALLSPVEGHDDNVRSRCTGAADVRKHTVRNAVDIHRRQRIRYAFLPDHLLAGSADALRVMQERHIHVVHREHAQLFCIRLIGIRAERRHSAALGCFDGRLHAADALVQRL